MIFRASLLSALFLEFGIDCENGLATRDVLL